MGRAALNSLYDILVCPRCRAVLAARSASLICTGCAHSYPIIDGVPVLLPPGQEPLPPDTALAVHDGYADWIHRTVMDSLLPDTVILEIGTGNMSRSIANVIRMDVTLTPHVDLVADVHSLPFRDACLDFVFALAVVEHLRNPFAAAAEIMRALRRGGYLYAECSFIFPFHGHPGHYFNASHLGLQEVFRDLSLLRSGVGPHQMPSFALRALLQSYRFFLAPHADPDSVRLTARIDDLLAEPLDHFDSRFSQEAALRVAACTYFFGVKAPQDSEVVPAPILQAHSRRADLRERFPAPLDLSQPDNLLTWARSEAGRADASVAAHLDRLTPFHKRAAATTAAAAVLPVSASLRRVGGLLVGIARRLRQRIASNGARPAPTWTLEDIIDGGERVTHLFPNDCFVAHRSIYHFALPLSQNARVLDAGSGAGYGAAYVAERGARTVMGVDISDKAVAFSRHHFTRPNLSYEVMPIDRLEGVAARAWDIIICSNVLEHVPDVPGFLHRTCELLRPGGTLLLAVPPIINAELRRQNLANPYHLNIWTPHQWGDVLNRYFTDVQAYQHWFDKPGVELNLINSPADTVIREDEFIFPKVSVAQLYELPTITAIFTARKPLAAEQRPERDAPITFVDDSFTRSAPG